MHVLRYDMYTSGYPHINWVIIKVTFMNVHVFLIW